MTNSTDLNYEATCALMEWDRILDLEELAITQPDYQEDVLESEKGNVKEELIGYANNTSRLIWQKMMKELGLDRWNDAFELTTVDPITLDDIKHHFQTTHTLKNMRFIFVGALQQHKHEIIERLENWKLPEGERFEIKKEAAHPSGLVHIRRPQLPNLNFRLYFIVNRELSLNEHQALQLLSTILTDTMHSRIWGTARQRGICYGMSSWSSTSPCGISELGLGGQVSMKNAKELFYLIADQLLAVTNGSLTEDELNEAKDYVIGGQQISNETVAGLAGWYGDLYYESDRIELISEEAERIRAVALADIEKVARECIYSPVWSFGGIGNITKTDLKKYYDLFAKAFESR